MSTYSREEAVRVYSEFYTEVVRQAFADNEIDDGYSIVSTSITARTFAIEITLRNPRQLRKALSEDVSEQLALSAQTKAVRSYRQLGSVVLEFQLPKKLWSFKNATGECIGFAAAKPVEFKLTKDIYCHTLVAGTSGSGKTEAIKTIIAYTMIKYPLVQITLCDPKVDYSEFKGLVRVAQEEESIARAIEDFYEVFIGRREANLREEPPAVLIIDEATDVTALGDKSSRPDQAEVNFSKVQHVARQGRAFGCHLIIGVQKAGHMTFPNMLDNINQRFVGAASDKRQGTALAGKSVGAELLTGMGDFLLVRDSIRRVQMCLTEDPVKLVKGVAKPQKAADKIKGVIAFLNTGEVPQGADAVLCGVVKNIIYTF